MSEGLLGCGKIVVAAGPSTLNNELERLRMQSQMQGQLFAASAAEAFYASAQWAPSVLRRLTRKPAPLLGETYMYPDERPVEPL